MIVAPSRVTGTGNRTRLTDSSGHLLQLSNAPPARFFCVRTMNRATDFAKEWQDLVARLRKELAALPAAEHQWMAQRLMAIRLIQEEMHACAAGAGSETVCAACVEVCCDRGRNHATLANLLFYLLENEDPPFAGADAPCPQLGAHGCLFPPGRRPFNCVTFNCESVEARMSAVAKERFYTLEPALRALYESFDLRYSGSSLRGILIRAARLGNRPLLQRPSRPPASDIS